MAKQAATTAKPWKRALLYGLFVVLLGGAAAFGAVYFKKYQDLKNKPVSAEQAAKAETDRILQEVSQLYDVPKDEQPIISTVKDKEQLKDQPFFNGAENGDFAVIYPQAKLAILYRPSTRKIIRASNVAVESEKPKVAIIGAEADRAAAEASLATLKDALTITEKKDASGIAEETVEQTTIVDVSGKNAELAKQLAEMLPDAAIGELPEGEEKPANADIVIIVAPSE